MKLFLPMTILLLAGCDMTNGTSGSVMPEAAPAGGNTSQTSQPGKPPAPPKSPAPPASPTAPPMNPAGIWDVNDRVNGNAVSEVALIANGTYFALAATDKFGCPSISGGAYSANVSAFSGSGVTALLNNCTEPNGGSGWTLSGYLTGVNLNLSFVDGGTLVPTLGATPDALYNEASSLARLTGNWNDGGNTLTVNADGTFFEQQASGCAVNGAYTILDPAHNLYGVSFEVSNCTSSLAGIPFAGLGYVDDSDPNAVHLLEDAKGPDPAGGVVLVFDNLTPL